MTESKTTSAKLFLETNQWCSLCYYLNLNLAEKVENFNKKNYVVCCCYHDSYKCFWFLVYVIILDNNQKFIFIFLYTIQHV